jgi:paraquat-inducible protein A
MSHKARNAAAVVLILISFALLVPGLMLPALTVDITPNLPFFGKQQIYHVTRSILGTVKNLWETGYHLVSALILLFSVIVPFVKGLLLLAVAAFKRAPWRGPAFRLVDAIGKWSMADVFVMGILLAYLAVGSAEGVNAQLHRGFWFFLGYCLFSVASAQLMRVREEAA